MSSTVELVFKRSLYITWKGEKKGLKKGLPPRLKVSGSEAAINSFRIDFRLGRPWLTQGAYITVVPQVALSERRL